ncbi:MAG: phosphotyrosine protein phosphatase, partial [Pseudomonadota bacterium]
TPLSGDLVVWADVVLVLEKYHRSKVSMMYRDLIKKKRLVCLDIPDNYNRMQPELVRLLETRVPKYVRL